MYIGKLSHFEATLSIEGVTECGQIVCVHFRVIVGVVVSVVVIDRSLLLSFSPYQRLFVVRIYGNSRPKCKIII